MENDLVLTLEEIQKILKLNSISEARRWVAIYAPTATVLYNPPRFSKELIIAAISRGRHVAQNLIPPGEVLA